jgi:hypothetical protein
VCDPTKHYSSSLITFSLSSLTHSPSSAQLLLTFRTHLTSIMYQRESHSAPSPTMEIRKSMFLPQSLRLFSARKPHRINRRARRGRRRRRKRHGKSFSFSVLCFSKKFMKSFSLFLRFVVRGDVTLPSILFSISSVSTHSARSGLGEGGGLEQ